VWDLVGAWLTVESCLEPGTATGTPDLPGAREYFRVAQAAVADPASVAE
jgi:hypothetical protein